MLYLKPFLHLINSISAISTFFLVAVCLLLFLVTSFSLIPYVFLIFQFPFSSYLVLSHCLSLASRASCLLKSFEKKEFVADFLAWLKYRHHQLIPVVVHASVSK